MGDKRGGEELQTQLNPLVTGVSLLQRQEHLEHYVVGTGRIVSVEMGMGHMLDPWVSVD